MLLTVVVTTQPHVSSASSDFRTLGTDPARDSTVGTDLTYLQMGPTSRGLELRFGLEGPLTATDLDLDATLHWTFWTAPRGAADRRTYFTVAAEFNRASEPTFHLTRWSRCTSCADYGAVDTYRLTGGYSTDRDYLAIILPSWLAQPGTTIGNCANHRTHCNHAQKGRHVFFRANSPSATVGLDYMKVSRRYVVR